MPIILIVYGYDFFCLSGGQYFLTFNTYNKLTYIAHLIIIFDVVGNYKNLRLGYKDKTTLSTGQNKSYPKFIFLLVDDVD